MGGERCEGEVYEGGCRVSAGEQKNCKYCNNGLGLDPCIKQYKVIISTSDDVTGHGRKNMKMGSAEARDETRSKLWHF